jgi:hypothetical protein
MVDAVRMPTPMAPTAATIQRLFMSAPLSLQSARRADPVPLALRFLWRSAPERRDYSAVVWT